MKRGDSTSSEISHGATGIAEIWRALGVPSAVALAERRQSGKASSVEDRRALRRSGRSAQFSRLPRLSAGRLRRRVELAAFAAAALGGALPGQRLLTLVGNNRRDD